MNIDYSEWKHVWDPGIQHRPEEPRMDGASLRRHAMTREWEGAIQSSPAEPPKPGVYVERYERDFWIRMPYTGTETVMSLEAIGLLAVWWGRQRLADKLGDGRVDDYAMTCLFRGNPEQFRQLLLQLYDAGHIRPNAAGEWELTPLGERGYRVTGYIADENDRVLWEALHMPRLGAEQSGFVYLMYDEAYGFHKIGYSHAPERRKKQLNKRLPGLKIRHVIETDDMVRLEYGWHRALTEWRVDGEWFDIPEEVVELFFTFRRIIFDPTRIGVTSPNIQPDDPPSLVDAWGRPIWYGLGDDGELER